jgi:hypothetical protein
VAFVSARPRTPVLNLFRILADGSTLVPEPLLTSPNQQRTRCWSPDGAELIYEEEFAESGWDILALPMEGERNPRVVIGTEYDERFASLSSDGRWLAYASNVTGRYEVWVRPYPGRGAPVRISPNGGTEPVWGREDQEIFYLEGDKMMAVRVETEMEFRFEPPEVLFEGPFNHEDVPSYDVARDGRFLMIQPTQEELSTRLNIVLNWFEELKRLAPTN